MEEIWKPIPGYDGYEASSLGRIKSHKKIFWTGKGFWRTKEECIIVGKKLSSKGYCRVRISKKVEFVHRLIAKAFIPNPHNKPQVNHINGIKTDNQATNLEWVTNQENRNHAVKNGLIATRKNGKIGKIKQEQIEEIKIKCKTMLQKEVAKEYGVGQQTISKIVRTKD